MISFRYIYASQLLRLTAMFIKMLKTYVPKKKIKKIGE
jgi:hypothetical protein